LNSLRASSKVCYILLGKSQDLPTLKTIYQVKNSSISIICYFGLGKIKKGNRQHASREKTLFLWSVRSMQAGRGFAKPFPKLPYMRGERGFCQVAIFCQVVCQTVGGVLSVFAKHQGC